MYCVDNNRVIKSNQRFSLSTCFLPQLVLKFMSITHAFYPPITFFFLLISGKITKYFYKGTLHLQPIQIIIFLLCTHKVLSWSPHTSRGILEPSAITITIRIYRQSLDIPEYVGFKIRTPRMNAFSSPGTLLFI